MKRPANCSLCDAECQECESRFNRSPPVAEPPRVEFREKDCSTRNSSTSHSLRTLKKRGDEYIDIQNTLRGDDINYVNNNSVLDQNHILVDTYIKYDYIKNFILLFLKNQSIDGAGIRFKFFRYFLVVLISIMIYL